MTKITNHNDIMIELTNFVNDATQKRSPFLAQHEACSCNECSGSCNCSCSGYIDYVAPSSISTGVALLTGLNIQIQATE
jgi:hypothetical protein